MVSRTQDEIMTGWDNSAPLVTIRCITYNHEKYIAQCIEGFLIQKTNFPFEILIHDDASTDDTAIIIRKYEEKFPKIIKPIYQTENQYSKHDDTIVNILNSLTRGKYIAICEGDDYWIDENKLQMQVDFLENNPEYTMCFHSAIQHYENNEIQDAPFSKIMDRDYSSKQIFKQWIIPTASVVYKSFIMDTDLYKSMRSDRRLIFGDTPLFLACSEAGKIRGFSKNMSVYRRHENGAVWGENLERNYKQYYHNLVISDNIPRLKFIVSFCNKKIAAGSCVSAFIKKEYDKARLFFKLEKCSTLFLAVLYLFRNYLNKLFMK